MPTFQGPPPTNYPGIKLIYLGHTGAGKTGSLVSLAAAGYRLRILDIDRGCEILRDYLTNPKSIYLRPHALWPSPGDVASRVSYVTITETYNIQGTKAIPKATAWHRINQLLNNWIDGDDRPGNLGKWGPNDVLVIDGMSRLAEAAMNFQLSLNGRLATGPQVGARGDNDYTQCYKLITDFLDLLKSDEIKCNIIMICHIQFMEASGSQISVTRDAKGFPQTVGRLISPKIGQYFNHSILAKSIGNAPSVRRTIITNNDENVELKTTAPLRVPREYPLETGLAQYFTDVKAYSTLATKEESK